MCDDDCCRAIVLFCAGYNLSSSGYRCQRVGPRVGGEWATVRDIIKPFVSSDAKHIDNSGSTVTNAYDSVSAFSAHRCKSNGFRIYIIKRVSDGRGKSNWRGT